MRVLLLGFGSRGDVQPLLALGHGLQSAGYDITIGAGINFQQWIESEGFDFAPIHVDMQAFMNSEAGKEWIENSSDNAFRESRNMKRMIDGSGVQIEDDLLAMAQNADVLVSGLPIFGMAERRR